MPDSSLCPLGQCLLLPSLVTRQRNQIPIGPSEPHNRGFFRTGDIGPERVLPLAVRDLCDPLPGHLEGSIVDQDLQPPQLRDRPLAQGLAVGFLWDFASPDYSCLSEVTWVEATVSSANHPT